MAADRANCAASAPVAGDASQTSTASQPGAETHLNILPRTNVAAADAADGRGQSASLSLFANIWASASSAIETSGNESVDGSTAIRSAALSHLTASNLVPPLFRHRATKSASSRTSVSSQPVLVRAYTSSERSRPPSSSRSSATPAMAAGAHLPPIDAFSFDGILRAVETEVHEAIDGIAEIYARSRLSLADEYSSHMPPQGEIINPRSRYSGLVIRTTGLDRTLTTVTEASSSSERLAGESRAASTAGSGKGKATAYGSLRSIISRGRSSSAGSAPAMSPQIPPKRMMLPRSWTVGGDGRPAIILKTHSTPSHQLFLDTAAELPGDKSKVSNPQPPVTTSFAESTRPSAWFLWRKSSSTVSAVSHADRFNAESALKSVLHGRSLVQTEIG
jgi:hypothetical protein